MKPIWRYAILVALLIVVAGLAYPPWRTAKARQDLEQCLNNLRMLDGAKEQWALGGTTPPPTKEDLVGTDKFIKVLPVCPSGGVYTIGDMTRAPSCSVFPHEVAWSANDCRETLRLIADAKRDWAKNRYKQPADTPTEKDLLEFLPWKGPLKCPAGGPYRLNPANQLPSCTVREHQY